MHIERYSTGRFQKLCAVHPFLGREQDKGSREHVPAFQGCRHDRGFIAQRRNEKGVDGHIFQNTSQ